MSSQDGAWTDIDVLSNLDQKIESDLWIVNVRNNSDMFRSVLYHSILHRFILF